METLTKDLSVSALRAKYLKNKKITIKPLVRTDGFITAADKTGATGFEETKKLWTLPNKEDGSYLDFLNPEEQEAFEIMLGFPQGSLGFYIHDAKKRSESFWTAKKFSLKISPEGVTLDLSKPLDFLKYKLALALGEKYIAPSWNQRYDRGEYLFVILEEDVMQHEELKKGELQKNAWIKFGSIETSNKKLADVLRLAGKNVAANQMNNHDFLTNEVMKFINETDNKIGGPKKFLEILEDPSYETKVLIQDAVKAGSLVIVERKPKTTYGFPGGERIGDILDTLKYLEDPMNADIKLKISAQVKAAEGK